jgi:hypothetical protein
MGRTAKLVVALSAVAVSVSAQQPSPRRATNIAALRSFPAFYHLRPVVVVGTIALADNGDLRLSNDGATMRVIYKGNTPDTLAEVRGEFWDLGRMNAVTETVQPSTASIRGIVLHPARFLDQKVTVTGQFAGRNLLGDLPEAPAKSRYDFVVRSADASIWVANLRPRGKDFELALDARIDTGRWVEVTGLLQQGRGLQWLDATGTTIALTKPPAPETTAQEAPIRVPAAPPPEVVFSAPTSEEADVALNTTIRVQFSRDISAPTLKGHVAVKYDEEETRQRGEPATPTIEFTTQYLPGNRVLEIRITKPLEVTRKVYVELGEGILGMDQQPLVPWKLTFTTGEP